MASNSGKDGAARGGRKRASAAAQKAGGTLRNAVRIIAGEWRGRRIRFPDSAELRPTPDRVRETLFNWLQATVPDARCLDLFAGSGALGLEALSRGARSSVFVERLPAVAAAIRASLSEFKDTRGRVVEQDALAYLAGPPQSFDLVFLDPPFAQGGLTELCKLLETRGWLAASASIYVEHSMRGAAPSFPAEWTLWREMRAGEVHAMLARRRALAAGRDQRMDET